MLNKDSFVEKEKGEEVIRGRGRKGGGRGGRFKKKKQKKVKIVENG